MEDERRRRPGRNAGVSSGWVQRNDWRVRNLDGTNRRTERRKKNEGQQPQLETERATMKVGKRKEGRAEVERRRKW
jgi:hypothetical protein